MRISIANINLSLVINVAHDPATAKTDDITLPDRSSKTTHAGTYVDPKTPEEYSDAPETVYATLDGTGTRRFFTSRFTGYPADHTPFPVIPERADEFSPASPAQGFANEDWIYRGVHAGTYGDPKQGCEVTYLNAINLVELADGSKAFFRTEFEMNGMTCWFPLPTTAASVEGWGYIASSRAAGTYTDPKRGAETGDFTWPGAVHLFGFMPDGKHRFYAACRQGLVGLNWVSPGSNDVSNEYWEYLSRYEAGSYANPKSAQWSPNATWRGAIYRIEISGQPYFFSSQVEGVVPQSDWKVPSQPKDEAGWKYLGSAVEGTYEHPKGWDDLSWAGQIHVFDVDGKQQYYFSLEGEGAPSQRYESVEQLIADSDIWHCLGERRHLGTFGDPKDPDEPTWPGAIHVSTDELGRQAYYASRLEGDPAGFPMPALNASDEHWTYIEARGPAGTFLDPRERDAPSWEGAIHVGTYDHGRLHIYYRSRVEGIAPEGGRTFPQDGEQNQYWQWVGKDLHDGDLGDPKTIAEFTWPGAIHAVPQDGSVRLYRSNFLGTQPPVAGWHFPTEGGSTEDWTLIPDAPEKNL